MRILLLGRSGQIGWQLQRTLAPLGRVVALGRAELDLRDLDRIPSAVRAAEPDLIVNAAAYTAVDRAEGDSELAWTINAVAPGALAAAARDRGVPLIHFSTDYVFDGTARDPYREEDAPLPINAYGRSKLRGEEAIRDSGATHLVLRTSWVYGNRGVNFLNTMFRLMSQEPPIRVVDDQVGAPTWSRMIAEAVASIVASLGPTRGSMEAWPRLSGVYHLTAAGRTTWHGFAEAIQRKIALRDPEIVHTPTIERITTGEFAAPAPRPRNSLLSNEKVLRTFAIAMPTWEDQLDLCLDERCAQVSPR
jgi:dTDP-4-dehydrorhamnose reductase